MGDDRDGSRSRKVDLDAGAIHYRESGSGTPIVFVHGFLANGRLWDETAAGLAAANRCIVPDWPLGSHPEAMRPDADVTPRGIARMISEFLAALELEDVTIVGNDSGGAVSQILVTEMPERVGRLVLTNCDCFEKFPPGRFKLMARSVRVPGVAAMIANSMRFRFMRRSPLAYGALTTGPIDDEVLRAFTDPSIDDSGVPPRRDQVLRRRRPPRHARCGGSVRGARDPGSARLGHGRPVLHRRRRPAPRCGDSRLDPGRDTRSRNVHGAGQAGRGRSGDRFVRQR